MVSADTCLLDTTQAPLERSVAIIRTAQIHDPCPRNSPWLVSVHPSIPTGFVEHILPGCDGGVKAPRPGVGNHLVVGHPGTP
jgi:hypothetical protein